MCEAQAAPWRNRCSPSCHLSDHVQQGSTLKPGSTGTNSAKSSASPMSKPWRGNLFWKSIHTSKPVLEQDSQITALLLAGPSTCPEIQPAVGLRQPTFANSSQHGLTQKFLNSIKYSWDVYSKYTIFKEGLWRWPLTSLRVLSNCI